MGMLADRLRKNLRHLRKWAKRHGFTCLRLYDHDIPELGLSLDDYEGHLLVTFSRGTSQRLNPAELEAELRLAGLEWSEVVYKQRGHREEGTLDPSAAFSVAEGPLRFEVNLHGYQDTGLFLDHRLTRLWVREQAAGRRVLNLFAYTGSFSVAAGAGGAARVVSVDLSRTYLAWARRNLEQNGLDLSRQVLVQDDILRWLPLAVENGERYELIVCDPPTFSNSKRMHSAFELQRTHVALLQQAMELLAPSGELIFSSNDRGFRLDGGLGLEEISARTRSEDFRRSGHRCWYFKRS